MPLSTYRHKRNFKHTTEPRGKTKGTSGPLTFVIQKHQASRLHYDFRLELKGVLKSWAIPKGPSLIPGDKRLAMMVEDHPLEYAKFEGIIPKGNYGAGTVMVWDSGVYTPMATGDRQQAEQILSKQLEKGHLTFVLLGEKLKGEFALVKAPHLEEQAWLLIKAADDYASTKDVLKQDRSVLSTRTLAEISSQAEKKSQIWISTPTNVNLSDAPNAPMPHQVKPMLARTAEKAFDHHDWLFEVKWDGYRAIAEVSHGSVNLYSRNQVSYTKKFSPVAESLKKIPGELVLDGEIVVVDRTGQPHFQLVQDYPNSSGELIYYVFDLLFYNGHDVTGLPLRNRKDILKQVLPSLPHIRFCDHVDTEGKKFFTLARNLHLEGMMAKQAQSTYQPGTRSDQWLKIKTQLQQQAIICGFTQANGSRAHFGALILGRYIDNELQYIGHTGTGFADDRLAALMKKLTPLVQESCPFSRTPKTNAPATWVHPLLVCDVTCKEWTKDGRMRHPVFVGLRDDAEDMDLPRGDETREKVGSQTITLTHMSKVFWPKEGYRKKDLVDYYREIASILLPYLKDRPQSLLRFPDGIDGDSFFQKEAGNLTAKWVKRVPIRSGSEHKTVHYLLCQDAATLLYMINLGCIDLNPWNSRVKHLEYPDYFVIDLDPEAVRFDQVVTVALATREVLEQVDIHGFCKTSGKRGLHIYVPTGAKYTYEQVRQFALLLCLHIQKKLPHLVSLKHNPKERQGKIYLDYLRNAHGQTTASVYTPRAYPGATVSTPLRWEEVTKKLRPDQFTIKTIPKRLQKVGDIFSGVLGKGINMEKALKKLEK